MLKSRKDRAKESLMANCKKRLNVGSGYIRAVNLGNGLARWENEGGAPNSSWVEERIRQAELAKAEEDMLQRLGAGIIAHWAGLPTGIQKALFQTVTATTTSQDPAKLKEQIARFLHTHGASLDGSRD
jgi:hypothetical protein